jgi:hypothetical protein
MQDDRCIGSVRRILCVKLHSVWLYYTRPDSILLVPVQSRSRCTFRVECSSDWTIIIIGCTALGGPWPPQANVSSALYPGHPPANFYNPVSLCLPLSRQAILISIDQALVDLQGLPTISFLGNPFSSICTLWPAHHSALDFVMLTAFGSL